MRRILLIEDNGDLSYDIKDELVKYGYEMKIADSYLSAVGMWERYNGEFNCIILDLNISPEGLSTKDSSIFFPCCSIPFMLKIGWGTTLDKNIKVVVYSGYVNELKTKCEELGISYYGMTVFEKSGTSFSELIKYIKENI